MPVEISGAVALDSFTFDLTYDPTAYRTDTACDPFSDGCCDVSTGPITLGTFYTDTATFPSLFVPGFILLDGSGDQNGQLIGVDGAWQDFTPPPSVAGRAAAQTTANGPYYAPPSWDQTLPAASRFVVPSNLNLEAVLDRETGLVWQRLPHGNNSNAGTTLSFADAEFACASELTGGGPGGVRRPGPSC